MRVYGPVTAEIARQAFDGYMPAVRTLRAIHPGATVRLAIYGNVPAAVAVTGDGHQDGFVDLLADPGAGSMFYPRYVPAAGNVTYLSDSGDGALCPCGRYADEHSPMECGR